MFVCQPLMMPTECEVLSRRYIRPDLVRHVCRAILPGQLRGVWVRHTYIPAGSFMAGDEYVTRLGLAYTYGYVGQVGRGGDVTNMGG